MATLTNVISNATGNVGIGTTSTATKLQVYSTTGTAQIFNQLQLTNMGGGNNGDIVGIGFAAGESTQYGVKGSIGFVRTTSYGRGDITFYTNNTAGTETVSTSNERMRIAADGNVGIGTTSTGYKLDLSTTLTGTTVGSNVVLNIESQASGRDVEIRLGDSYNSSKRLGYLSGNFYIASGTTENFRIDTNGNVGIGSSSPAHILDIVGSSPRLRVKDTGTSYSTLEIESNNAGGFQFAIDNSTGTGFGGTAYAGTIYKQGAYPIAIWTNAVERMRITPYGDVGIGTTNPGKKLTINNGSLTGAGAVYPVRLSGGTMSSVGDSTGLLFVQRDANDDYGAYIRLYTTQATPTYLNPRLEFGVQTTDTNVLGSVATRMVITGDGYVGIGTTSPKQKLTIVGEISLRNGDGYYWNAYYSSGFKYIGTGYAGYTIIDSTGAYTINTTNSSGTADAVASMVTRMYISSSGNVGIGTTSPLQKLHVVGNISTIAQASSGEETSRFQFYNIGAATYDIASIRVFVGAGQTNRGEIGFYVNNGATQQLAMYIDRSQNVGIGTTSPASKLHISGSGQTIMRLDSSTTTNISQFMVKANTDGVLIMGMSGGSAASTNFGVTAAGQAYIGTTTLSTIHPTSLVIGNVSNIPIVFSTTNTEKARITPGGSLLVGTTVQAANTAGTAVATNFKGINAYEFNDTTGRGSTQGISWNYLINTTHIIDISPGDTVIAFIDVRLAAYSSSGSGYANSLFCYGGHVGAYNITTVFNVVYGNIAVSAAIVSDKLRITITIANSGQAGECVLTVTDANKNGTLSTIVRS